MTTRKTGDWTRRRLLGTAGAALLPAIAPHGLRALAAAAPATPPFSHFEDVAQQAGLTRIVVYGEVDSFTYIVESMACGCAFLDYDNDGWLDIFMPGGQRLKNTPPDASNRLYKNNRDGTFTDVTEKAGLKDTGWAQGVCVGDYNNDGFEDIFVTYYGQNKLFRNNGDGTFTDVTAKAGLLHPTRRFSTGCTFVDYNRDGFLDLFVSNYLQIDLETAPKPSLSVINCNYEGIPVNCGPNGLPAAQNYLYRNNGDGTFTDVSKESGIAGFRGSFALTAIGMDADEDGWPDIFVACDSTPSLLLMNNHDGTFREEGLTRGVALSGEGVQLGGMGVGVGDYNLDGHTDLVKTHFQNQATGLYRNDGQGNFEDVTVPGGLNKETRYISFGAVLSDFDNDGYPDILVTTGTVYPELDHVSPKFPARSPRILFRNQRDGSFAELGPETGPGISARHCSRGVAFGDFDNDGDLDLLVMNVNEAPSLLRNDAPPENHWIKIRLEGTKSNRSAIGARVIAKYGGKVQSQELVSQSGFLSANDPRLHFGLGSSTTADIEIHWPAGGKETYQGLAAGQLVTIREGQGVVKGRPFAKSAAALTP